MMSAQEWKLSSKVSIRERSAAGDLWTKVDSEVGGWEGGEGEVEKEKEVEDQSVCLTRLPAH